jgi:uncharacterized protein with PhoU and TrkA domain
MNQGQGQKKLNIWMDMKILQTQRGDAYILRDKVHMILKSGHSLLGVGMISSERLTWAGESVQEAGPPLAESAS